MKARGVKQLAEPVQGVMSRRIVFMAAIGEETRR